MTSADSHMNAQNFRVSDGTSDTFTVQASSGNSVIAGSMGITGDITGSADIQGARLEQPVDLLLRMLHCTFQQQTFR